MLYGNSEGKAVPDRPKEYECHFRRRLNQFLPSAMETIDIDLDTNVEQTAAALRASFIGVATLLDPIESPATFLERNWLQVGSEIELRARLNYVLGNYSLAIHDLALVEKFFSDRQDMSVNDLIRRYKLENLKSIV